jgi:hypothetical protein
MIKFVTISKLVLVLALLPASASAVTITISAPSDSATEITLTATGTYHFHNTNDLIFSNIGEYVPNDGPDGKLVALSAGIFANGVGATEVYLDHDNDSGGDDFGIYDFTTSLNGVYTVSGSATADLSTIGYTFGDLIVGTYERSGNTLIVQYSSVPDTGSTAALFGVGVAALAFARRRLGQLV